MWTSTIPVAAVNIGAVGTAYRLQQATQIPTLIHWTTRSRNLISIAITPARGGGIGYPRYCCLIRGTIQKPVPMKPPALYRMFRGAIQLMELIARLNRGELADGSSIGEPCGFYYGGWIHSLLRTFDPHVKTPHK